MQALWSSCRCRTCLHSSKSVIRRSTTAASRRKLTATDVFTACYTTILGTAAIIDNHRKGSRRQDLDEKLERARSSLNSLTLEETQSAVEKSRPGSPRDAGAEQLRDHDKGKSRRNRNSISLDELGQLAHDTYAPRPRSSWLQYQADWVQLEAAIRGEEKDPNVFIRHPRHERQLERTTRTIENLVQDLLSRAVHLEGTQDRASKRRPGSSDGDRMLLEAQNLLESYPIYESPYLQPDNATTARELLSETFRRIFNRTQDAKEVVGKICYNLLLSSAAPNIHNYNTLIAGFNRIRRPDLAEAVIHSYLDHTRWPATQSTIVCLLDHAKGTNNLSLFREIVGRMRGTIEDGLHIRIISKDAVYNEDGFRWAAERAASRSTAYVERASRTPQVFESLIRGWLYFGNINAASMSFVACLRQGLTVSIETIYELLTECLAKLNRGAAGAILDGLARDMQHFEMLINSVLTSSTTPMACKIAELLCDLCDLHGYSDDVVLGGTRKELKHLLQLFRDHTRTHTQSAIQETTHPPCRSLDKCDDILTGAVAENNSDSENSGKTLVARIALLDRRLQTLDGRMKRIDLHAKALILQYRMGHDIDTQNRLPPIDWQNRKPSERTPGVVYALQALHPDSDLNTLVDVKDQLLRGMPDQHLAQKFKAFADWGNLSLRSLVSFYDPRQHKFKLNLSNCERDGSRLTKFQDEVLDFEHTIKAILFCQLPPMKQTRLRNYYRDWRAMPAEKLYEYFHRSRQPALGRTGSAWVATDSNVQADQGAERGRGAAEVLPEEQPCLEDTPSAACGTNIPIRGGKSLVPAFTYLSSRPMWSEDHSRSTLVEHAASAS